MASIDEIAAKYGGIPGAPAATGIDALAEKYGGSIVPEVKTEKSAIQDAKDKIAAFGAGVGKGVGNTALTIQDLIGSGLSKAGRLNHERGVGDLIAPDAPVNMLDRAGQWLQHDAQQGKAKLTSELSPYKQENPMTAGAGELTGEVTSTLPVGGILGKVAAKALPSLPIVSNALTSGGFRLGVPEATTALGKVGQMGARMAGGAAVGGATAGLINPDDAMAGSAIGALMPPVVKGAGYLGSKVVGTVAPEVAALYEKAKNLGIDIPADRLTNSKPLNALASSLNYIPFSGRQAVESNMHKQLNVALSNTVGQNTDNVTGALRKASGDLGQKFDAVLSNNTVKVDKQFLQDLVDHSQTASNELGPDGASIINKQIDTILGKAQNGAIDGQAAYNIKKTLDRIGSRNTPEAYYAKDLKQSLMDALNRSLSPQDAADFATVRKQYGNMLALEKMAQNGAEGDISIGRLANMKNIRNQDLQDLADVSAQFLKTRENPHGAAQRVTLGALAPYIGGAGAAGATGGAMAAGGAMHGLLVAAPIAAGGMATGRLANAALNSNMLKNAMINQSSLGSGLLDIGANPLVRSVPLGLISTNP